MLITTKETSTLIAVDVERFSGSAATCYFDQDIDKIIGTVKELSAKELYDDIAAKIASFVFVYHASTLKSAIRKSREILRKKSTEKGGARPPKSGASGAPSGSRPSTLPDDILTVVAPVVSRERGASGDGSQIGRSSQGTTLTGGSAQRTSGTRTSSKKRVAETPEPVGPAAPKSKKKTLEKIPTHLEQKAQSMSMDARVVYQEEILERCGVQEVTMTVDIGQLHPLSEKRPWSCRFTKSDTSNHTF